MPPSSGSGREEYAAVVESRSGALEELGAQACMSNISVSPGSWRRTYEGTVPLERISYDECGVYQADWRSGLLPDLYGGLNRMPAAGALAEEVAGGGTPPCWLTVKRENW